MQREGKKINEKEKEREIERLPEKMIGGKLG